MDDPWPRLHRSMITALEHGHATGAAVVQMAAQDWRCIAWQEVGPRWCVVAVGNGSTAKAARALADERLANEVTKHGDHPPPGSRVRNPDALIRASRDRTVPDPGEGER